MLKNKLFYVATIAVLLTFAGVTAAADYWTFTHTFMSLSKDSNGQGGTYAVYQGMSAGSGQLNPAYDNYNEMNTIQDSTADGTDAQTYRTMTASNDYAIRPDGFSYGDEDIDGWLASASHALLYSTAQDYRIDPQGQYWQDYGGGTIFGTTTVVPGLDYGQYSQTYTTVTTDVVNPLGSQYTGNDDIRLIEATQAETIVKHAETQYSITDSLGVYDLTYKNGNTVMRNQSFVEYAMGDFQVTADAASDDAKIYFSIGNRYTSSYGNITMYRPGADTNSVGAAWNGGGSGFNGAATAADVLTQYGDENVVDGVFVNAWKLAGTMVGDQFWNSGLVWNTYYGYVSTSTSSNSTVAVEAAGHDTVRDFLRYVFDISALKAQDVNGDGVFDVGTDKLLFSVVDDSLVNTVNNIGYAVYAYKNQNGMVTYGTPQLAIRGWTCDTFFAGQFFDGDVIFLYDGTSVTTYMDPQSGIFYGQHISTSAATIWAEEFGQYQLTGFDLTYGAPVTTVPEPTTIILIAGSVLAGTAGLLRRKFRA